MPFRRTSEYLGMKYLGFLYFPFEKEGDASEETTQGIVRFSAKLTSGNLD